jgi:ribosomal protein S6--L-glutamate ligase
MARPPLIIRTLTEFRRQYPRLAAGDLVVGYLPLKPGEEIKVIDLVGRGVRFFPPYLAQALSRSKAAQAEVLGEFMVPGTRVAYRAADLAGLAASFPPEAPVVCKRDRGHLGLGVSWWPSLQALLSLAGLQTLDYPLVIQPFVAGARDFRAVLVGAHAELYERRNPHSFRHNLFQGGISVPTAFSAAHQEFCRRVMARGSFPYAVLDLLLSPAGNLYLSEINLRAGLRASRLGQAEFRRRAAQLEEEEAQSWANSSKTPP